MNFKSKKAPRLANTKLRCGSFLHEIWIAEVYLFEELRCGLNNVKTVTELRTWKKFSDPALWNRLLGSKHYKLLQYMFNVLMLWMMYRENPLQCGLDNYFDTKNF